MKETVYIVTWNGNVESIHKSKKGARKSAASLLSLSLSGITIKDTEKFLSCLRVELSEDEEVYALTSGGASVKVRIYIEKLLD